MSRTTIMLLGLISFIITMCLMGVFLNVYGGILSLAILILWLVSMAILKQRYWGSFETGIVLEDEKISGISGWLVFPAIGLILTPLMSVSSIFKDTLPVFMNGTLAKLSNPLHPSYSAMWVPLVMFEMGFQLLISLYCVFVAVAFFQKRKYTPMAMIVLYSLFILFRTSTFAMAISIPFFAQKKLVEMGGQLVATIGAAVLWILYFIFSKRVKATFTV